MPIGRIQNEQSQSSVSVRATPTPQCPVWVSSARRGQLDTLRFFCFLAVFCEHCHHPIALDSSRNLFIYGGMGVAAFFVISGFLITRILCVEETGNFRKDVGRFYIKRALRILPVYYLFLGVLLMQGQLEWAPWHFAGLYNCKVFMAERFTDAASHFWTLCIEEQFYLLFPWMLLICPKKWRVPALSGWLAASIIFTLGLCSFHQSAFNWLLLPVSAQYFLAGALFAQADLSLRKSRWDHLLAPLGVAAFVYWLSTVGTIPQTTEGAVMALPTTVVGWATYISSTIAIMCLKLGSLGLIVYGLWRASNPFLLKLLNNPVTTYLGKISYGLYVYHFAVTWYLFKPESEFNMYAAFAATIVISAISWQFFETPINRLRARVH